MSDEGNKPPHSGARETAASRRNTPSTPPSSRRPPVQRPRVPTPPATRKFGPDAARATKQAMRRVTPGPLRFIDSEQPEPRIQMSPNLVFPAPPERASRRPPVSKGVEIARLAENLAGETLMGRYRVEIPLGRGSSGIVFRAHDLPNNRRVAIKLLDPELAADPSVLGRFRAEALAPSRIGTEHVVMVFEADVCPELVAIARPDDPMSPPIPYLVMELLEGRDLRTYLQEEGPMTPLELIDLMRQIAPTIDRAHELGIVHRDLKPANLFLSRRSDGGSVIKVLDFGIAQLTDATAARGLGGGLFGTPWYMAPEQAEGRIATAASDRWALAMVVFRLLTGQGYWAPSPLPELLAAIIAGPNQLPSEVVRARGLLPRRRLGAAFDGWFTRACQVLPERRFTTVHDQVEELARALATDGAT